MSAIKPLIIGHPGLTTSLCIPILYVYHNNIPQLHGKNLVWVKLPNLVAKQNAILPMFYLMLLPFMISCSSFANILPFNQFGLAYSPIFYLTKIFPCTVLVCMYWYVHYVYTYNIHRFLLLIKSKETSNQLLLVAKWLSLMLIFILYMWVWHVRGCIPFIASQLPSQDHAGGLVIFHLCNIHTRTVNSCQLCNKCNAQCTHVDQRCPRPCIYPY